jgi:hypothetical protein
MRRNNKAQDISRMLQGILLVVIAVVPTVHGGDLHLSPVHYWQVNGAWLFPTGVSGISEIMVLNLIKVGDVPAIGKHNGTFTEIKTASGKDAEGNEFNHLIVTVELETTDSKGQKYRLQKQYNLAGRGLAMFRNDYRSWSNKKLSDKDLAAFDTDTLMKDKPTVVVVTHSKDGKDTIARIDTFLPVPAAAQASG